MSARNLARSRALVRRAFTLVEMLIAMTLTLILVYAIAEFYAYVGDTVKDGRAMIVVSSELRGVTQRLKADFDRVTAPLVPWGDDSAAPGYFEIGEGGYFGGVTRSDADTNGNGLLDAIEDVNTNGTPDLDEINATTLLGDWDDYLGFTIRSEDEPLVGNGVSIQSDGYPNLAAPNSWASNTAEVAWWTSFSDLDSNNLWSLGEPRILHRRQLVIRPDLNVPHPNDSDYVFTDTNGNNIPLPYFVRVPDSSTAQYDVMQLYDVSLRYLTTRNGKRYFWANSLSDLTHRENRFMHTGGGFPNMLDLDPGVYLRDTSQSLSAATNYGSLQRWVQQGIRKGDDVILSNALAFDVRVYDPYAPLYADDTNLNSSRNSLQPGDPGWSSAISNSFPLVGRGAFVDLHYDGANDTIFGPDSNWLVFNGGANDDRSQFSAAPHFRAGTLGNTYDVWALSYERDGINQDAGTEGGSPLTDEGTNGLDDDGINGVDDLGERETSPPYPYPLRGIEVKIRLYEPSTRQMRQATVGADFLPE